MAHFFNLIEQFHY